MLDVPALALVDDTQFGAGVGACVVGAGDGNVGDEEGVIKGRHPIGGEVIGVEGGAFVVVFVV